MADSLQMLIELVDKATAPLQGIQKQLDKLEKQSNTSQAKNVKNAKQSAGMRKEEESQLNALNSKYLMAAAAVGMWVAAYHAVHAAITELSGPMDKMRISIAQLAVVEGGNGQVARETYEQIKAGALATGQPLEQLLGRYKELRNAGLDADQAMSTLASSTDLQAFSGQGDAVIRWAKGFKELKDNGIKFVNGMKLLEDWKGAGLTQEQFAKAFNLSGNAIQMKAQLAKMNLDVETASNRMAQALNDTLSGGGPGGTFALQTTGKTITSDLERLKAEFSGLFETIDWSPIKNMLFYMRDMTKTMKEGAGLGTMFAASMRGVGYILAALGTIIFGLVYAIVYVGGAITVLLEKLFTVEKAVHPFKKLSETFDGLSASVSNFVNGVLASLGNGVFRIKTSIEKFFLDTVAYFNNNSLYEVGEQLIMGLWKGIASKWHWFTGQFEDLVDQLPDSVKKVLKIESPSKVMAKLGGYTVEGFSVGAQEKMQQVAPSVAAGIGTAATSVGGGKGGGKTFSISIGDINVNASGGNAEEISRDITQRIRAEVIAMMEELSGSMSGDPEYT